VAKSYVLDIILAIILLVIRHSDMGYHFYAPLHFHVTVALFSAWKVHTVTNLVVHKMLDC